MIMLNQKNSVPLLYNSSGFPIRFIILMVLMSVLPSVFGDTNTSVECQCEKPSQPSFEEFGFFPPSCDPAVSKTKSCETGWCFKVSFNVEKPASAKGNYKAKGCAYKQTKDKCDETPIDEPKLDVKALLKICHCHENNCNVDSAGSVPFSKNGFLSSTSVAAFNFLVLLFSSGN